MISLQGFIDDSFYPFRIQVGADTISTSRLYEWKIEQACYRSRC
jgi:hypothetical protein